MDDRFLIQTAQNVELSLAPAGVGDRILAWLADLVVWGGYALLMSWVLSKAGADDVGFVLLVLLPVLLYDVGFEVLAEGQTPGKMLLKIRVARLDGAQPTLGQYALRWLLRFVDVTLSSGTVAVVAVAATRRQQRLGDIAAGTTVVRVRRRVRLDEVLYPEPPRGYVPRFPEAAALTDADVRTLRAVLV
ncbi:MAG TPA: RDD family protein, partial [Rubricoccaceae bacterium]